MKTISLENKAIINKIKDGQLQLLVQWVDKKKINYIRFPGLICIIMQT